jgi:hypothetical protein
LLRPVVTGPKNRAEILDERAPGRAEADATRGLKEQVRVLKQQLAACVAAAAAQDAEKTALLGQVLRLRQQVGAPADEGDNRALKEQVLALKQKALTSTVREAAGCSGESATREMAVTSNNTAAALAPVRGARDGEGAKADSSAQALLERAEDEILTFWLIRGGGGAGGDEALTEEFFERADEVLDAQQLGERMLGVLGVQLEPAVIEQLMNSIGCGTKYISPEALRSWVHTAYPLFELEQMLLAVHLPKIVARHLVRKNGQEAAWTREEVHVCVLAAASDIVDGVYSQIAQLEEARRAAPTGGANGKFAGDDLCGTIEGKFASAQAFHDGLDRHLGLPDTKVLEAIINEHKHATNANTPYTTIHQKLTCRPRKELEAALCPIPGEKYPGAGSGEHEREILPLRVFLGAAGCLRKERWEDQRYAATLKKLESLCGSLELNEEDKVHEAMSLLMMALQGFSATMKAVQRDLAKRCEGDSGSLNLDAFYAAMAFVKGWDSATTFKHMERGRALFSKADLLPEEVLAARMHTGPQFMHYNASLRQFPEWVLDTMHGNRYVTTIHCINSAIIKLARASPIEPLVVYRGSKDMRLPRQFAAKDDLGRQGDVELAFMSCASEKSVALNFAKGEKMSMILAFERGAMSNGAPLSPVSFYRNEEEICFPPLCSLEVKGRPQILFTDNGAVLQVTMGITVNQKAETVDGLVGRRKFLHLGMLRNLVQEVESEMLNVVALLNMLLTLKMVMRSKEWSKWCSMGRLAPGVAENISGSKPEQALAAFAKEARQICEKTLAEQDDKPATEFNDDDTYSALVKEAVKMKSKALKDGRHYKLLCAWFAHCAKADVRALEAVVKQLDVHMWTDSRVVDERTEETPLLAACAVGSLEICKALIKAGASATAADKDGNTPLLAACAAGSFEICEMLIKAGADVNAADKHGNNAIYHAEMNQDEDKRAAVLAVLAEYGDSKKAA